MSVVTEIGILQFTGFLTILKYYMLRGLINQIISYVMNKFWQAAVHVKRNYLEKLLTKICNPDFYASFGTF